MEGAMSDKNDPHANEELTEFLQDIGKKWPLYNYKEIICTNCSAILFHHQKLPFECLPPQDMFRCRECGGSALKKRRITRWEATIRDPLKRRRTRKI
ncbi:hypothetical protein AA15669_1946 [Saccharibacter floricola DSM 15669]|uniref:Uncharacterized protein n=1 Tax=Saccharibacter floricola DSM 15669 TaxID=1123227 RepID=A0ABQ0P182_9PROT|nr:hypothetical protein AA15669_1946 [Saccharibacter floricola DSM 15669]